MLLTIILFIGISGGTILGIGLPTAAAIDILSDLYLVVGQIVHGFLALLITGAGNTSWAELNALPIFNLSDCALFAVSLGLASAALGFIIPPPVGLYIAVAGTLLSAIIGGLCS